MGAVVRLDDHRPTPRYKGTLIQLRSGEWVLRILLPDGSKERIRLPHGKTTRARAEESAAAFCEQFTPERMMADRARRLSKVDAKNTVAGLGRRWAEGKLLKEYGPIHGLREKKSADTDAYRLELMNATKPRGPHGPTFGELPVSEVTEQDVEAVFRCLRAERTKDARPNTIANYLRILHRLFALAERPCRLRPRNSNPVDSGLRPTDQNDKLFSFLLPHELVLFLNNTRVPLVMRVATVLGCYVGFRRANLAALRWADVDLEHGTIVARSTKNGVPLRASLHFPCVERILHAWFAYSGRPSPETLVLDMSWTQWRRAAERLRAFLQDSGVKRPELFAENDPVFEPLRFHDLRSTFVTWAMRDGMSLDFIKRRTGHLVDAMVDRYTRQASSIETTRFQPFPDVSIPELRALEPSPRGGGDGGDREADRERDLNTLEAASEPVSGTELALKAPDSLETLDLKTRPGASLGRASIIGATRPQRACPLPNLLAACALLWL